MTSCPGFWDQVRASRKLFCLATDWPDPKRIAERWCSLEGNPWKSWKVQRCFVTIMIDYGYLKKTCLEIGKIGSVCYFVMWFEVQIVGIPFDHWFFRIVGDLESRGRFDVFQVLRSFKVSKCHFEWHRIRYIQYWKHVFLSLSLCHVIQCVISCLYDSLMFHTTIEWPHSISEKNWSASSSCLKFSTIPDLILFMLFTFFAIQTGSPIFFSQKSAAISGGPHLKAPPIEGADKFTGCGSLRFFVDITKSIRCRGFPWWSNRWGGNRNHPFKYHPFMNEKKKQIHPKGYDSFLLLA